MLLYFILIYLALTVALGLWASRRVRNSNDFLLAGRGLPLYLEASALFATWFGAETVMGASSSMAEGGLYSVIEDPFGASLCLFLIGMFFARKLYRMDILTFGDFYRVKYGKWMELAASICLVLSYIGWIAAQMVALGSIMHLVVPGISPTEGIWICSLVVVLYTFTGGMWSVAITDFVQSMLIIIGILLTFYELQTEVPLGKVISQTPDSYFRFFPNANLTEMLNYAAAWITIGLGSIPQQDVFQRIMASKSEKVAVRSSYIGGFLYLTVAVVPLILVLYARILEPSLMHGDTQLMLPKLIQLRTSLGIQIIFFGALLSAVMSTASGALLAPSAILGENIIGHYLVKDKKRLLFFSRLSVLIIAAIALSMALSNGHIYELVGESSALSLVSLFVPMVAGIYWKKANPAGAILSLVLGMAAWMIASRIETEIEPILYGLGASIAGMLLGTLVPRDTQVVTN